MAKTQKRETAAPAWLLLLYHLPVKPSKTRVRIWRRLQKLGALQIKGSAYVLPNSPQAREDFEWIRAEVVSLKGEAAVFAADTVDAWGRDAIVAGFQAARSKGYEGLREEIRKVQAAHQPGRTKKTRDRRLKASVKGLRERWSELQAVDFFAAPGREEARAALEQLERLLVQSEKKQPTTTGDPAMPHEYQNRVWLTRPRPGVDRMSSAWLIRRFIDPQARFAFADKPARGDSIPFDMYGVEFSHEGDACTFETLARRFGIQEAAVQHLGKIVHDLDLKDGKFQAAEAAAVGGLVEGLRRMYAKDDELLQEGMKMFEALYRSLAGTPAV